MDRIDQVTKDCFNAIIQLKQLDPAAQPPPEALYQRLRSFVDAMAHRAQESGYNQEDVRDITYAVVALIDEVALASPGAVRNYWISRPLQLHYFNENVAGDNFFYRLEQLRQDPRKLDVLRVFFLCLALGFQGRYRIRGGEAELAAIFQALEQDLQRARLLGPDALSPHGDRPQEARARASSELPLVWLSLGAILLSTALYIGLRISLASETQSVVQRIEAVNSNRQ